MVRKKLKRPLFDNELKMPDIDYDYDDISTKIYNLFYKKKLY